MAILDGHTTGLARAFCYDLKLVTGVTSPWTVRRSSDNATRAAAFLGDNTTDRADIDSWAGGASLYITSLTDQSANAAHATQATMANQPRIRNGTTWEVQGPNSRLAGMFDGSNDLLTFTAVSANTDWSAFTVYRRTVSGVRGVSLGHNATGGGGPSASTINLLNNRPIVSAKGTGLNQAYARNVADNANDFAIFEGYNINSSSTLSSYKNGAADSLSAVVNFTAATASFNAIGSYGGGRHTGYISAVILWTIDKTADRASIYADLRGFFFGQPVGFEDVDTGWEVTGMTVDQDLAVNDVTFGDIEFGYEISPATINQVQRVPLADVDTGWEVTPMTVEMDSDNVVPLDDLDYGWEITAMTVYQGESVEVIPEQPKVVERSHIHLIANGAYLDPPTDFEIEVEMTISNPEQLELVQDRMYRFVLPTTPKNVAALGILPRMSTIQQPKSQEVTVVLVGKSTPGKLTVWKANEKGIDVSIGMGVYSLDVMDKNLREVDMGEVEEFNLDVAREGVNKWWPEVNYCFPTIAAPNYYGDRYQDEDSRRNNPYFKHLVNHWNYDAGEDRFTYIPNYIDGTDLIPRNENAIVPQVFLMHILKSIFGEAGLDVGGAWLSQQDIWQMWVWNNRSLHERINHQGVIAEWIGPDNFPRSTSVFEKLTGGWEVVEDMDSRWDVHYWLPNQGILAMILGCEAQVVDLTMFGNTVAYIRVYFQFYYDTGTTVWHEEFFDVPQDGDWHAFAMNYTHVSSASGNAIYVLYNYECYDIDDDPVAYGDVELMLRNMHVDFRNLSQYTLSRVKKSWTVADYVPDMTVGDFLLNLCGCANLELKLNDTTGIVEFRTREKAFDLTAENWDGVVLGQPEFEFREKSFVVGFEKPNDEALDKIKNRGWRVGTEGAEIVDVDADEEADEMLLMEGAPLPMVRFKVNVLSIDRDINIPITRVNGYDEPYEVFNENRELRLMFYRGRKVVPFANYLRKFEGNPLEQIGNINWVWIATGEEADYTLYALYWRRWLALQTTGVAIKMPILLTAVQLNQIDLYRPKYMMSQLVFLTRLLARVGRSKLDAEIEGLKF